MPRAPVTNQRWPRPTVNNQSVLLRGVNDSLQTQLKLCQGLLKIKVRPYYLFQCDDAAGTEHFWTSVETGIEIIRGMRGFTSGLAIPNYVIDLPNGKGKITLQPDYVLERNADELVVRNYLGEVLRYPNPGGIRRRTVHSELVCDQPILA